MLIPACLKTVSCWKFVKFEFLFIDIINFEMFGRFQGVQNLSWGRESAPDFSQWLLFCYTNSSLKTIKTSKTMCLLQYYFFHLALFLNELNKVGRASSFKLMWKHYFLTETRDSESQHESKRILDFKIKIIFSVTRSEKLIHWR